MAGGLIAFLSFFASLPLLALSTLLMSATLEFLRLSFLSMRRMLPEASAGVTPETHHAQVWLESCVEAAVRRRAFLNVLS